MNKQIVSNNFPEIKTLERAYRMGWITREEFDRQKAFAIVRMAIKGGASSEDMPQEGVSVNG